MLSYQHAYHAGNHADILKHYVLSYVIEYLNKKPAPYTFYDTHSGSGLYDLFDNRSRKTGEAEQGIISLLDYIDSIKNDSLQNKISDEKSFPDGLKSYINLIRNYSCKNYYPGSPEIERQLLRKGDFLLLSELHPQEIENLKNNLLKHPFIQKSDCPSVQIHNRNGWEMLKALTPPKTKRGAVLIDPSYEELSDYDNARKTIASVLKKWSNGIIMLWYPLLNYRLTNIQSMLEGIILDAKAINQNIEIEDIRLQVFDKDSHKESELEDLDKKNPPRLYGSGILVLNAPWKLKESSEESLEFLTSFFYKKVMNSLE
ncbi:MAG: 23S rRNA (adenine(2030)-N(6))-methyltransferase RlmJ [Treponema sp.]|nr:23S rRNA (adenine(2030)-N(6))-methyltransferase RlmJ [Treponema sp.]